MLLSLGFSDSEAVIYLTSLELGPSSVQDIAKKSKVSRVTTYAVIESLSKRGLMSFVDKGKKRLFVAESPERLVSFVQTHLKNMEATLKEVESSLQDLKLMQQGDKPVVKLFEGHEALKAIQDDLLKAEPKHIDEFGNLDEIFRTYSPEEVRVFHAKIDKLKPKIRAIFSSKTQPVSSHSVITLPSSFVFGGDVLVYDNKVALSTFRGKQISVLIESEEIARLMKTLMDYIWSLQQK